MQQVPGHVLHHGRVAREDGLGVHDLALLGPRPDVPQTDGLEEGHTRVNLNALESIHSLLFLEGIVLRRAG